MFCYSKPKVIYIYSIKIYYIYANTFSISFEVMVINLLVQSKLFITSLFITAHSISDINLQGTDLFPLKCPLYNRILT